MYCDLLMQQVHSMKTAAGQDPPDVEVDIHIFYIAHKYHEVFVLQKMNDSTHLLSATCDTFISTLEDCLRLAKADSNYHQLPHSYPTDKALSVATSGDVTPNSSSPSDKRSGRSSRNGP